MDIGSADAVRVAKVNNLAFRGKFNLKTNLQIFPFIGLPDNQGFNNALAGIAIIATF